MSKKLHLRHYGHSQTRCHRYLDNWAYNIVPLYRLDLRDGDICEVCLDRHLYAMKVQRAAAAADERAIKAYLKKKITNAQEKE